MAESEIERQELDGQEEDELDWNVAQGEGNNPQDEGIDPHIQFVGYQLELRGDGDRDDIEHEWDSKTPNEQGEWSVAYSIVLWRADNYRTYNNAVREWLPAAQNLMEARVRDFDELDNAIEAVIVPYDLMRNASLALSESYTDLAGLEQQQVNSQNNVSINNALERADYYTRYARWAEGEIERLNAERQNANRTVPPDAQARRRIPREWNRKARRTSPTRRAIRAVRHARRDHQIGLLNERGATTWVPCQRIQELQDHQSEGTLWAAFDENDRIMDRVFRKDCYFNDASWHDIRLHDGDLRDPTSRTPWELACHNAMLGIPGLESVVRLREGTRRDLIDHEAMTFRVYVEWCQHGDLESLINRYRREGIPIPEPMIWCVAEHLADCAVAMQQGTMEERRIAHGWREIVHRDIKPANIFLAENDPTVYPLYPDPLLGDFGLARCTTPQDPNNPRWLTEAGTYGWYAPEQYPYIDQQTQEAIEGERVSAAANIYGIGAILAAMVRRRPNPRQPIWLGEGNPEDTLHSFMLPVDRDDPQMDREMEVYSEDLRIVINMCLDYDPAERLSPTALKEQIARCVREVRAGPLLPIDDEGEPENHARGMRSGRAGRVRAEDHLLPFPGDPYRIGMARARVYGR